MAYLLDYADSEIFLSIVYKMLQGEPVDQEFQDMKTALIMGYQEATGKQDFPPPEAKLYLPFLRGQN